jgi:hypothetical protein
LAALHDEAPARRFGRGPSEQDKSMGTLARELKGLVVAYARQETVDPLKKLGRYLLAGLLGSLLLTVGSLLLMLAAVRAAQTETGNHLHGDLSWVPYVGGLILAALVLALAASRIRKAPK